MKDEIFTILSFRHDVEYYLDNEKHVVEVFDKHWATKEVKKLFLQKQIELIEELEAQDNPFGLMNGKKNDFERQLKELQ